MRSSLFAAATAAVMLASVGIAHATVMSAPPSNLISDGDFNNNNSSFATISSGSYIPGPDGSPSAWYVNSGSIDLIGGYWNSPSGPNAASGGTNGSVDLDGNSPGSISQVFNVTSPGEYTLKFDLSGNPDGGPQTVSVSTSETGVPDPTYSYTIPAGDSHDLIYTPESETFYAAGPTTLTFTSNTPGAYGPVIGNVSVSAVPEPATWLLMIAGIGGLGLALRASRKRDRLQATTAFAA